MNEQQLTKAITDLLQACRWYVIRTHRPGQFATQPGVSDLIAVGVWDIGEYAGRVAFIEVKGPRGKIKPEQEIFLSEMRLRGHIAFVADSIDVVIEQLKLPVLL